MATSKRGQGSLEFLMTYGWVLLVILVIMVVMWQWGLFNLGERVEPGNFGFWGLTVQGNEFILNENGRLQVSLLNTVGANVTLLKASVRVEKESSECDPYLTYCLTVRSTPVCGPSAPGSECVIVPGESAVLEITNSNWMGESGKRFEAHIVLTYNDTRTGANTYQSSGRLWGNVEK
ncbi:MAG: hypothetical protein V1744_01685 [Candidatus Altiarchaeota archaeon]